MTAPPGRSTWYLLPMRPAAHAALLAACILACDAPASQQAAEPATPAQAQPSPGSLGRDPALPGIAKPDLALTAALRKAGLDKAPGYQPRTHHLRADRSAEFTNRLIRESSPYLLQHAHNPVNWFPWGDEAFARARAEGKPVFLSVGYSTCHWCHVMEVESFEDEEIAAFMNSHFIAIKVDREQRPDIDGVYMTAVNMLVGRGGWPMTVVMTPDKQPFFGGTYFPPRDGARGAGKGLLTILTELSARYQSDRAGVVAEAAQLSRRMQAAAEPVPAAGLPEASALSGYAAHLERRFDPQEGGFGRAPKFPQASQLEFGLRYARRARDTKLRDMVLMTLRKMAAGGIHDQIGGGFHRYSTDARWLVPHFEKMLYDNAQLLALYADAYALTGDALYARVARRTADYLIDDMQAKQGGFYSATDADSLGPSGHMEEGYYFTWSDAELQAALQPDEYALIVGSYGTSASGNFEHRNILHWPHSPTETAKDLNLTREQLWTALDAVHPTLLAERAKRTPPARDDKVLAAWNGLAIRGLAHAGRVLGQPRYTQAARQAADFVLARMRGKDGRLRRSYPSFGEMAFAEDYTMLVWGLLEVFEAQGDASLLQAARDLQAKLDAHHLDGGGYYRSAIDGEVLLTRERPSYDGAVPSANSVAALNLLRLERITGEARYREQAEALLRTFARAAQQGAAPLMLAALDSYLEVPFEIALVTPRDTPTDPAMLKALQTAYLPHSVALWLSDRQSEALAKIVPWLEGKRALRGKTTAFVCERGHCELPTTDARVFAKQLAKPHAGAAQN